MKNEKAPSLKETLDYVISADAEIHNYYCHAEFSLVSKRDPESSSG